MIKEIRYQRRAVDELVEKTLRLLDTSGARKRLVFHAPTGSGKTVMASAALDELTTALKEQGRGMATIWIAPNKLHEQSYFRMRNYFSETRALRPALFDELDHSADGYIRPGEILFVNWESINKEKNLMVRETEQTASLYDHVRRTCADHGLPLLVVIDEEHEFAGRTAKQSERVLQRLQPKVELRISATPRSLGDELVSVSREEVVKEEMVKDGITINPALDDQDADIGETAYLLDCALSRCDELRQAYAKVGARVNPLLLIQLPNDSSEALDDRERSIVEQVKTRLADVHGITTDNGRLAVWLSADKRNLDGIERTDSPVDALLFKQAIAMGWDCPRAAVLLIFRDIRSTSFGIQTVGRIMRMPEQRFYPEAVLNHGWVYTNLSRDRIEIVAEDMNYISKALVARRRADLCNVVLPSVYSERPSADRNRLGPDFYRYLVEEFNRSWFHQPIQQELFDDSPFEN